MGCTSAACRSLTCSLLAVLALNGFLPRATLKSRWVFWRLRWCLYANAKHPEERSLWRMVPQFSSSQKSQHFVPVPLILIVSFTPFIMPERRRGSESTIREKLENMFVGYRPINKDWFLNGSQRKQLRKKNTIWIKGHFLDKITSIMKKGSKSTMFYLMKKKANWQQRSLTRELQPKELPTSFKAGKSWERHVKI